MKRHFPTVGTLIVLVALPLIATAQSTPPAAPPAAPPGMPPGMATGHPHPTAPTHPATPAHPRKAGPYRGTPFKSVTLHISNRVFPNFHDRVIASPGREFRVGDTDYTATVIDFVPDFSLDLKSHKVTSRGTEPKNPAFRIAVARAGAETDTTWAFFNMPPHYGPRDVLAFVATRIEFTNRAPLVSTDSLAMKYEKSEGDRH